MPLVVAMQVLLLASGDPVQATSSLAASDAGPLAGCAASPGPKDGFWKYECRGVVATVIDDARKLEPGPYLDDREAGIRKADRIASRPGAAPDQITFSRENTRIAGREAAVLRARTRRLRTVVALFAAPEGTRVVSCVGGSERCASVVEALAAAPWRAGPTAGARARSPGELRFGDSSPVVPPGCRPMPNAFDPRIGMITCPEGNHVGWVGASDDTVARLRDGWVSQLLSSKQWPGDPEDVPCRIAGMDASCTRLTARAEQGRGIAMWGTATVDETRWFAFCAAQGEEPVPSPCSSVFSVRGD